MKLFIADKRSEILREEVAEEERARAAEGVRSAAVAVAGKACKLVREFVARNARMSKRVDQLRAIVEVGGCVCAVVVGCRHFVVAKIYPARERKGARSFLIMVSLYVLLPCIYIYIANSLSICIHLIACMFAGLPFCCGSPGETCRAFPDVRRFPLSR